MKKELIETLIKIAKIKGAKYSLNVPILTLSDYNQLKGSVPTVDFVLHDQDGKVIACFEITTNFSKGWTISKNLRQRKFKLIEKLCYLVFKAYMLKPQIIVVILPLKTPALSFWAKHLSNSLNIKILLVTPIELQQYATTFDKVG